MIITDGNHSKLFIDRIDRFAARTEQFMAAAGVGLAIGMYLPMSRVSTEVIIKLPQPAIGSEIIATFHGSATKSCAIWFVRNPIPPQVSRRNIRIMLTGTLPTPSRCIAVPDG